MTPVEALEEAVEALNAYKTEPEQTWNSLPYVFNRILFSFSSSVLSLRILQLPNCRSLKNSVEKFSEGFESASGRRRKGFVSDNVSSVEVVLREALKELKAFYFESLCQRARAALRPQVLPERSVEKIGKIVPEISNFLSYCGRVVEVLAEDIAAIFEAERDRTDEELCERVYQLLTREPAQYSVATVITGAVDYREPLKDLQGRALTFPGPVRWMGRVGGKKRNGKRNSFSPGSHAESDLYNFCMEHWKVESAEPSCDHFVHAQVFVWDVRAWDPIQARHIALDKAETLMDRINAEHRIGDFGVKRKVLVLKHGEKRTCYLSDSIEGTKNTRAMREHDSPSVQRSLRLASRASTERAGAMAIFFGWSALEYLGRGNEVKDSRNRNLSAQAFVATYVPKIIALSSLQHLANDVAFSITGSTPVSDLPSPLKEVLQLRKGPRTSRYIDQKNLFSLLAAGNDSAGAGMVRLSRDKGLSAQEADLVRKQFNEILEKVDLVTSLRIDQVVKLRRNAAAMAEYLRRVEREADVALQRMRYVRNQTAHSEVPESLKYRTLSKAMREFLDTCYQAMDKDRAGRAPHMTILELAGKFEDIVEGLRRGDFSRINEPHYALYASGD
ncbi:hypothetical protein [Corynebacterium phocae]|uniref:hypothetical protein n=1 Tax=Corynebacterium phocae TaxID=161895 RepID=UPI0012395E9C|nr:hypothetical protein [Corynebacterium phocae]KAA8721683.1 hypothetical protein F4V58_10580 [Corynebacterium phocae]